MTDRDNGFAGARTLPSCFFFNQAKFLHGWHLGGSKVSAALGQDSLKEARRRARRGPARRRCRHFLWAIEKPQNCRFNFILLHSSLLPKEIVSLCCRVQSLSLIKKIFGAARQLFLLHSVRSSDSRCSPGSNNSSLINISNKLLDKIKNQSHLQPH